MSSIKRMKLIHIIAQSNLLVEKKIIVYNSPPLPPPPKTKDQTLRIRLIPTLHPPKSFQFHFINPLGTPRLVEATKMGLFLRKD